ncbi:Methyltransferase domain-containing protein [Glycomyces sambucus]|uniref:Methyltransferase domain-containing protein n=1 Tax=Glycomyces sambucus TaxID=380244 RepID=A0A1G9K6Y4_9ACTN|nr:class I SAM-dependent methyltransferase [Glycomyces sambucus]SDL45125.1 Methyltransferase domain-containing protein [Glycomyces sambucus]
MTSWEWDETLYAGAAVHYGNGRIPYPAALAEAVRDALGLDGTGRLLDVGCGPGSLTVLLAPLFAEAVGVDADPGMIAEARLKAPGIHWQHLRAERLPADLGTFRVASFAQSFHWMDRDLVAKRVRPMLCPEGAWIHIGATTHRGMDSDEPLPLPSPPWEAVEALVRRYLGPVRRAGQGVLPDGTAGGEDEVMRRAGFSGPEVISVGEGRVAVRSEDEIVASVFSLSSSAPHLFGDRLAAFEADLRAVLREAVPDGRFAERFRDIGISVWRP